ncbi:MAG: two-component sensor histidine kinase, partial [Oscillospiraceae bacterium]
MINKLRRRFILIAMSSVTLVIVLLSLSINIIYFISTNSDLNDMLEIIYENQGAVPEPPRGGRP